MISSMNAIDASIDILKDIFLWRKDMNTIDINTIDINKIYVVRIHFTADHWIATIIEGYLLDLFLGNAIHAQFLKVKEPYGNSYEYFIITKNILYISYFETTDKE